MATVGKVIEAHMHRLSVKGMIFTQNIEQTFELKNFGVNMC